MRVRYARDGLEISVICPGFVVSRMTADNPFSMPFLMSAERAAHIIGRGLARNRGRIGFPFPTYMMGWLLGALGVSIGGGLIGSLVTALIGAVVLLFIVGLIKK